VTESTSPSSTRPERAFLDANVIRGQLTNDVLLSLAERDVFEPRWSQHVIDEMRRNRPAGVDEARIDKRIAAMNRFFPRAMTQGYEGLEQQMHADAKDKHVLAAAVHSSSNVLVTDNVKDFDPPSSGPHAMRVERLSQFLSRKLEEDSDRVLAGLGNMIRRNRRDPRTMAGLIDKMAAQHELRGFAQKLNSVVPPDHRGTHPSLAAKLTHAIALDGTTPPAAEMRDRTASQGRRSLTHPSSHKVQHPEREL